MSTRWQPGEQIVLRELWAGRVWCATPMTAVQDTPELLALYRAHDVWFQQPRRPGGERVKLPTGEWSLVDTCYTGSDALWLLPTSTAYAVAVAWYGPDRAFEEWYIDLQRPLGRSARCLDVTDDVLDITVNPDQTTWIWKDEQEFAEAQTLGLFTTAEAAAIRVAGYAALADMRAGVPVFAEHWQHWQPDPSWPVPRLQLPGSHLELCRPHERALRGRSGKGAEDTDGWRA